MSAWIIALALSAGYLINKNVQIKDQLEQASTKYNRSAEPAEPGPTSDEIRSQQSNKDLATGRSGGKYDDFNQGTGSSRSQMNQVLAAQDAAAQVVQEYESRAAIPEIQGVMMIRDNYGI